MYSGWAKMQLIFGVAADGRVYPDFPGPGMGALDESVVGPAGLVNILETQLGLTGPRPVEAVRIAAYAGRLRAVVASNAQRFFAASLEKDPWATARLLLGWRDQLVAAGWSGNKIASRRLEDLAAAEAQEPVLPDGLSDRLRSLLVVLEGRPPLLLESLTLIEHRSILPLPWQRLVEMLGNCGVVVRTLPRSAGAEPGSDLRRVQDFLADGSVMPLQGDGSFTLVQADTTLMAAETLAEWLAAGTGANLDGTVILSSDGDSALLDKSLTARGLPALGQSSASPWRGALQVLPLAFAIAWKPFNPKALLDLLLLPRPPISRSAARKLAHALTEEPGTGAGRWERAWTEIEHDLNAKFDENAKGKAAAAERLSRWREWTSGGLYGRSGGMPATDARAVAARVAQWAIGRKVSVRDARPWGL